MTSRLFSHVGAAVRKATQRLGQGVSCGDRSLRRKLFIGTAIAVVCTVILAAGVISRSLDDYRRASQNLREIESYQLVLEAANRLSAERGPSNSLLGDDGTLRDALRDRLNSFRNRSDAALDRLSHPPVGAAGIGVPDKLMRPVLERLAVGRLEVDRVAAIPLEHRQLQDVQSAIEAMFEVVDIFQPVVDWKAKKLVETNPELAGPVMTSRMFGQLREYGGRIASQIMAPIAVSQPLPMPNLVESNRTRGRLLQLAELIGDQDAIGSNDPRIAEHLHEVNTVFFGKGLDIFDSMVAEGRKAGNYSMTADEFTIRFVETLKPLERLRNAFLDITIERLTAARNGALAVLILTIVATSIILATLAGLIVVAQRFVFRPLMHARDAVIDLAADRPVAPLGAMRSATEIRRLFEAIDILRGSLAERASLTRKLKHQAETDGLTGLMNRRALDMIGESHTSSVMMAEGACLILMDIDHFKAVNDRHGHLHGDHVLKESVQLVRAMLDPNVIFARFGGEEFAMLIPGQDLEGAVELAGRIRIALEANAVALSTGPVFNVTASFGVARGSLGRIGWRRLIEASDAALYRAKSDGRNCVRVGQSANPPLAPEMPDERQLIDPPRKIAKL